MSEKEKTGLKKMMRYCAYQERAISEVYAKLNELGLSEKSIDRIVQELIQQNYINESRYAETYVRSKLFRKQWGRIKINYRLAEKQIHEKDIENAWKPISEEAYKEVVRELIASKISHRQEKDVFERRNKIANSIIQKGFEPELVWSLVKELVKND